MKKQDHSSKFNGLAPYMGIYIFIFSGKSEGNVLFKC